MVNTGSGGGYALPLHVESRGSGPDLILLHGFGANSYTWRHWQGPLSEKHRIHMVDLKGFGSAPAPRDGAYSPVDHAELIRRFIRARDLRNVTLVGHSFGGTVALVTALLLLDHDSDRLGRMVLIAGAAYPQRLPFYMRMAARPLVGPAMLRLVPGRVIARKALESAYLQGSEVTRGQVEAYGESMEDPGCRYAMIQTVRQLMSGSPEEWTRRYPEVAVPTLLLWGRQDPIVPLELGRRLEDDLPDATLEILDDCGHVPQEERPRQALEPVMEFLAQPSKRSRKTV